MLEFSYLYVTLKDKDMKAILKVTSKKGAGTIYATGNKGIASNDVKFVLEILGKKLGLTSLSGNMIVLNPTNGVSYLVVSEEQVKLIFGITVNGGAKLEVTSFGDGSIIPAGQTVNVNNEAYLNEVTIEHLIYKITRKYKEFKIEKREYTGKKVDSGCGFKMADTEKNWSFVSRFGFDAIEMVDTNIQVDNEKVINEVNAIEID